MKPTLIFFSILALVALTLAACAPFATAASPQASARSMTVTGAGQATLSPDIAYISIGVHTEAATAADAMAENNTRAQKLIDTLKQAGVAEKDLQTTNFSIWSGPQYGPDGQLTGQTIYTVENMVYVTVRDLNGLGNLLDQAVGAGANSINNIQFDVADKTKALAEARNAAVQSAKTQAAELAGAAGVKLGDVQTISYYDSAPAPVFDARGLGGGIAAAAQPAPINPGTMQVTVTVTLTYEIK